MRQSIHHLDLNALPSIRERSSPTPSRGPVLVALLPQGVVVNDFLALHSLTSRRNVPYPGRLMHLQPHELFLLNRNPDVPGVLGRHARPSSLSTQPEAGLSYQAHVPAPGPSHVVAPHAPMSLATTSPMVRRFLCGLVPPNTPIPAHLEQAFIAGGFTTEHFLDELARSGQTAREGLRQRTLVNQSWEAWWNTIDRGLTARVNRKKKKGRKRASHE